MKKWQRVGGIIFLCLLSFFIGWEIGNPDSQWKTWHFEDVSTDNETVTLLLYEEDIISSSHNGTRWEIEVKPVILYHVNRK